MMSEAKEDRQLLTVEQFAAATQTSRSWVYERLRSGEISSVRLPGGHLWRIPSSELLKLQGGSEGVA